MGYSRKEIEESLIKNKYDEITATYLLLGRRTSEVCDPQPVNEYCSGDIKHIIMINLFNNVSSLMSLLFCMSN